MIEKSYQTSVSVVSSITPQCAQAKKAKKEKKERKEKDEEAEAAPEITYEQRMRAVGPISNPMASEKLTKKVRGDFTSCQYTNVFASFYLAYPSMFQT